MRSGQLLGTGTNPGKSWGFDGSPIGNSLEWSDHCSESRSDCESEASPDKQICCGDWIDRYFRLWISDLQEKDHYCWIRRENVGGWIKMKNQEKSAEFRMLCNCAIVGISRRMVNYLISLHDEYELRTFILHGLHWTIFSFLNTVNKFYFFICSLLFLFFGCFE